MKRTKGTKRVTRTIIGHHIGEPSIYVYFHPTPSLKLETVEMCIGRVRSAIYSNDPESDRKNPYIVQCYLPGFPCIIGRCKTSEDAKKVCLRIASLFVERLHEQNHGNTQ